MVRKQHRCRLLELCLLEDVNPSGCTRYTLEMVGRISVFDKYAPPEYHEITMMFCTKPPTSVHRLHRVVPVLLVLLAALALTACQPLIEVVQPPSSAAPVSPPATVTPDERGVAIMGVDFDPPLDASQIMSNGGVTLLVAIENEGQVTEPLVRVSARLSDSHDGSTLSELINETITVRSLAPDEVRVVRFTQVTELPLRSHYKLAVEVLPIAGERDCDDNVKTYDIIVRGAD